MVKATLKAGAVLLGLVIWSVPTYAEVQNIRIGGDITIRAIYRENLDLHDETSSNTPGFDSDNFLMTTTGINIGADLTENVSAFLRLVNERDWDTTSTNASSGDIDISQAYITLKELFYAPLTLTVGTQPIVWGRGFVLGSNLLPSVVGKGDDRNAAISANEFTDFTSFDAIRATLDLSDVAGIGIPLTADYVYVKLDENAVADNDDVNLQGVNFSTTFDNGEADLYYLNKRDRSPSVAQSPIGDTGSVHTLGMRGSTALVAGGNFYGELAYQWGRRATDFANVLRPGVSHQAWAADLGAEYTFADVATTPTVGGEWIYFSGKDVDGAISGWDPIARGYFTTALREFQTATGVTGFYPVDQAGVTNSATNQHQLALYGGFEPMEDLGINTRLTWFLADESIIPVATGARESYLGLEWDTQLTYAYTEDVEFGVLYALFAPGNAFRTPADDAAQELVTSVSVKF